MRGKGEYWMSVRLGFARDSKDLLAFAALDVRRSGVVWVVHGKIESWPLPELLVGRQCSDSSPHSHTACCRACFDWGVDILIPKLLEEFTSHRDLPNRNNSRTPISPDIFQPSHQEVRKALA